MEKTMNKSKFYFEVTDTFGGELNYCWLSRFIIEAKTLRGALMILSRHTGLNFRNNGIYYKARRANIAAYLIDDELGNWWLERATNLPFKGEVKCN